MSEMSERERQIREEVAGSVERILEDGGTEKLLHFIREGGELNSILATVLVQSRDWEEDSDAMIDSLIGKLPVPWWVPGFVVGKIRKEADEALPELVLNPILERLLVEDGVTPDRLNLYAYLQREDP